MWRQLWRDSAGCCCGCGYGGRAAVASSGTRGGGDTAGQVLINLVGPLLDLRSCFLKCFSILSINAFAANNFKPRAVVVAQWVERLLLTLEVRGSKPFIGTLHLLYRQHFLPSTVLKNQK